MTSVFPLLLLLGGCFGFLGSIVAYLVTYKEWSHHYATRGPARKMALETAIITFVFFLVVAFLVGLFF